MFVERHFPVRELASMTLQQRALAIQTVIDEMGPCAEIVERDGLRIFREDLPPDRYVMVFDVPGDPSFLLL